MPGRTTVHQWVLDDVDGFANQYARAKAIGIDEIVDEAVEIADTPVLGTIETDKLTKAGDRFTEVQRRDMTEHRRLRVDTRKWYASKLAPKLYGERQHIEHSGEINTSRTLDDEQRLAKIEAIFAAVERRLKAQSDGSDLV